MFSAIHYLSNKSAVDIMLGNGGHGKLKENHNWIHLAEPNLRFSCWMLGNGFKSYSPKDDYVARRHVRLPKYSFPQQTHEPVPEKFVSHPEMRFRTKNLKFRTFMTWGFPNVEQKIQECFFPTKTGVKILHLPKQKFNQHLPVGVPMKNNPNKCWIVPPF